VTEREALEAAIRRYNTILRFIMDDGIVAVVSEMLTEARDQLSKIDRIEGRQGPLSAVG